MPHPHALFAEMYYFLGNRHGNEKKMINLQHQTLYFLISVIMALNTEKNLKLYYSIKEVAAMLNVPESMLRFWEKEIPMIRPKTTGNNVRQYTQADIENVKAVYNLVKVRGFKLSAARKMLRENKQAVDNNARIMESLIKVRDELKLLKKQLDYLE